MRSCTHTCMRASTHTHKGKYSMEACTHTHTVCPPILHSHTHPHSLPTYSPFSHTPTQSAHLFSILTHTHTVCPPILHSHTHTHSLPTYSPFSHTHTQSAHLFSILTHTHTVCPPILHSHTHTHTVCPPILHSHSRKDTNNTTVSGHNQESPISFTVYPSPPSPPPPPNKKNKNLPATKEDYKNDWRSEVSLTRDRWKVRMV